MTTTDDALIARVMQRRRVIEAPDVDLARLTSCYVGQDHDAVLLAERLQEVIKERGALQAHHDAATAQIEYMKSAEERAEKAEAELAITTAAHTAVHAAWVQLRDDLIPALNAELADTNKARDAMAEEIQALRDDAETTNAELARLKAPVSDEVISALNTELQRILSTTNEEELNSNSRAFFEDVQNAIERLSASAATLKAQLAETDAALLVVYRAFWPWVKHEAVSEADWIEIMDKIHAAITAARARLEIGEKGND